MKRLILAVVAAALFLCAAPVEAQQRGLVGAFALTTTCVTNDAGIDPVATALDLPSVSKLWVWLTVYGGPEGSQTGAVTCTFASSPDGTTWTTKADTNFTLAATMDGTNRITVMQAFDLTGVRQIKPIYILNADTVGTATNIAVAYSSQK